MSSTKGGLSTAMLPPSKSFDLLNLPPEVRNRVYNSLFAGRIFRYQHEASRSMIRSPTTRRLLYRNKVTAIAILAVSKQIYSECRPIFHHTIQMNLRPFINIFYGTFDSPIVAPTLIQHASLELRTVPMLDLTRSLSALINLKSFQYEMSSTFFEEREKEKHGLDEVDLQHIKENLNMMVGRAPRLSHHWSWEQEMIGKIVDFWVFKERSFKLTALATVGWYRLSNESKAQGDLAPDGFAFAGLHGKLKAQPYLHSDIACLDLDSSELTLCRTISPHQKEYLDTVSENPIRLVDLWDEDVQQPT